MIKHKNNDQGFGGAELFMVLLIIILLAVIGWLVYKREHKATTTSTNHQVQITLKAGWLIYKSSNSSAEFQYPASWKLAANTIQSSDKYTLESLTITGTNNYTINYSLNKTNHNPIIHNASCVAPPKVTILDSLNNNLAISYSSYADTPEQLWIGSVGNILRGYGYANAQCQVDGTDYVSLPNDEYIYLDGSYPSSVNSQNSNLKTTDYLNQPEVKTAIDILKSFSL